MFPTLLKVLLRPFRHLDVEDSAVQGIRAGPYILLGIQSSTRGT